MKVIYEFGSDDTAERKIFDSAMDLHNAIWDIYHAVRQHVKYDQGSAEETLEQIREIIAESGALDLE